MKNLIPTLALALALSTGAASAQSTFQTTLLGVNEVGPNASPGTGFGQVVVNAAHTQITVDENWSGLTAPATASHIHGPATPAQNAGVLFPFSGVPAATSGAIPTQTFAITAAQFADLSAGLYYMNVHTSTFPGGEIRGQLILVPEPSTLALVGLGLAAVAWNARRRRQ